MGIRAWISDVSNGRQGRIDGENSLRVSEYPRDLMPSGTPSRYRYYRALLGSTGADSGTTNQNVDGSVTAQEFYIEAAADHDICFTTIVVFIGDATSTHKNFGAVSPLANGWDLKVKEAGVDTKIIDAATTNGEVIIQSATILGWGNAATAFELTDYNAANDDGTLVNIPVGTSVPGGIRLGVGTKDRLISVVNDNLTGLVTFNVYGIGYRHYDP